MKEQYKYCGEQAEQNIKDDIKEIIHAVGKEDFIKLFNEVFQELAEADFELWQESSVNNL